MTKVKPLMDRILLKSLEKNMTLDSGIYVPESANTERPYIYEVIDI
jgi:co-chaperonin GroES (HSP10)